MTIISLAIQKGGSGKTTTAINLAAALREMGKSVLLVDVDPQANLSQALGINGEVEENIYKLIKQIAKGEDADVTKAIIEKSKLSVIPSSLDLANAELELVSVYGREIILKNILKQIKHKYDYIIIDCPPAIGMLTVNALVASDYVLIPLQAEYLPLKGVQSFMHTFHQIKKQMNNQLQVIGFLLTKYESRKTMNRQVSKQLNTEFGDLVFKMDDKLESFIASLYGDIKTQLDYSVNSLEKTEQQLINTYKTPEAIDALHRAITVDGFCRYIGEVFRKKIGGYWDMSFKHSSAEQFGPYITGFDATGRIIAPYQLMKKLLELKSGVYLKNYLVQLQDLHK